MTRAEANEPFRLLVVSHPAVLPVNQLVYAELQRRGIQVTLVTPAQWKHEYAPSAFAAAALPELRSAHLPLAVALAGRPQRHFYLTSARRLLRRLRPQVVFLEQEPFSLSAAQWAFASRRAHVPFGVQIAENLDRPLPAPVIASRTAVLRAAAFVAARSWSAAGLARRWGATGTVALAFHHTPLWDITDRRPTAERVFTVGYAGRLVPEKGLADLVAAVRLLDPPVRLVLAGDGPIRDELAGASIPGGAVEVMVGFTHDTMPAAYGEMDVLVLPSRTTATWSEQFGRVIPEALWCGVPVVGSDSGEIPRLIEHTGGGLVFHESDINGLAQALRLLRADPTKRQALASAGATAVRETFSVGPAADQLDQLLRTAIDASPHLART